MTPALAKYCAQCGQSDENEFYRYRASLCKRCDIARSAAYRKAHPDKALAWDRSKAERDRADPERRARTKVAARLYAAKHRANDREGANRRQRDYRKRHPERMKIHWRKGRLKKLHGLTPTQYDVLALAQHNICAICKQPQLGTNRPLAVDHDHRTGLRRDLLCDNCNKGIGCLGDDPDRLIAAAAYLRRHTRERH